MQTKEDKVEELLTALQAEGAHKNELKCDLEKAEEARDRTSSEFKVALQLKNDQHVKELAQLKESLQGQLRAMVAESQAQLQH